MNKVKSIVIVGGGTSGWLAAAYLSKNFPLISVTVVDKEVGSPIGVGEATLLNFKAFMDECGFSVHDWFHEIDAGYKSGILFSNWEEPGHEIWHPFFKGNRKLSENLHLHDVWTLSQEYDFKKYALSHYDSSIIHNTVDVSAVDTHYGYHVDCTKLVKFVQGQLENKISIIRSEVVDVIYNGDNIDYLMLKNGDKITGSLFVDCTGFKGLLRTAKKRIDLSGRLFCDTAIACPVPYKDKSIEFKPYATCDAVDHGWVWKIGVASRIGSGLVFNRNITSIDEAKDYFVNYWDNRIDRNDIRVIDWTPFYNEDQWHGNVVSIGLSAGFIEPLESTGIGLITGGITQLSNAIQELCYSQDVVDYFNLQMKLYFEDSIDFVSMHYAKTNRTTKFWSWVKDNFKPSEKMEYYVEQLKDGNMTLPYNGRFNSMFVGGNWTTMLAQMGYSIASRNIGIDKSTANKIIETNYIKNEKFRHVWSRKHSDEIERLSAFYKL